MIFKSDYLQKLVEGNPQYEDAIKFAETYEPQESVDYRWVAQHAAAEYERFRESSDMLDAKADSLLRYMGAGTGIAALGLAQYEIITTLIGAIHVLPALVLMLVGVLFAARARAPVVTPVPLLTRKALDYADGLGPKAEICFAAMTAAASEGLQQVNKIKADLIRASFGTLCMSVAWLLALALFRILARVLLT